MTNINMRLRGTCVRVVVSAVMLSALISFSAHAATNYWKGTGTDWGTAGNWISAVPGSTDVAAFTNATYTSQPSLGGNFSLGMLWQNGAGAVTVGAGSLRALTWYGMDVGGTVYGIRMDSGSGALTLSANVSNVLQNSQTWLNNSSSLLTVSGAVNNNGTLLTIDGTGNTTLGGVISGKGGLTKTGTGTLTLSGANTFSGQLTVQSGWLSIASINNASAAGVLGNSALPVILGSSGNTATLNYTGSSATSSKPFTLADSSTGIFQVSNTLTLTGLINGSGTLTKTGAGTLVLSSNPNQFTGPTVISGGKLKLGAQFALWQSAYDTTGSTGAIGLDVTGQTAPWLGGLAGSTNLDTVITGYSSITSLTLNPQSGSSVSYDGVIANGSGNMALNKTGHGTQILTGANTYSGATTNWAGTLALSGANGSALNSAFTVLGGTLLLDNSGGTWANRISDTAAFALGSVTLTSFNGAGAQTETVGATTFGTSGKVTINNGATAGDQTTLAMGAVTRSAGVAIDFVGTGTGTFGGGVGSPNVTSTGAFPGRTNGILPWATVGGTQWAEDNAGSIRAYSGGFVDPTTFASSATSNAQFTGTGTLSSAKSFNSLNVIASGAGQSFNLNSNLTLTAGAILKSGTDAYTIRGTGAIIAGTELRAHVDGGTLTISAPLNTAIVGLAKGGTGTLVLSGTRAATWNGAISIAGQLEFMGNTTTLSGLVTGSGGLTVNLNPGQTLYLNNNANSYAGPTIVKGGYLATSGYNQQGMPGSIKQTPGASSNTSLIMSNLRLEGGIFYATYVFNKDLGAGPGQVQILAGTSGFVNVANQGGATGFTLDGGRELVWGSTYFNPTVFVISLNQNANLTVPLANGFDLNGSTRTFQVGETTTGYIMTATGMMQLSGVIRDSQNAGAGLTKTGIGTLLLTGASTFNGAVTVNGGTLAFQGNANVASANPLGQSSAAAANLLLANGAALKYIGAAASIDRSFTINGTADGDRATLDASGSGAINFTSTSSPAYGTANQTRTLILAGTNTANNTLAANIADNGTGAVSLIKTNTGTWVLSGNSTYTGPTTIIGGTLQIGNGGTAGSLGSGAVINNATLIFNRSDNLLVGNNISGSGRLIQAGTGTTILTGTNTYSNVTLINSGVLQVGNGGASGTLGTGNITNSAALVFNRSDALTVPNLITGTGALTQIGPGTLELTRDNSYAGGTIVSNGTLLVNNTTGYGTGSGAVTVVAGATLGGTGAVATLTLQSGAVLAPGSSPGTLTVDTLTMNAGSTNLIEITSPGLEAGTYDVVKGSSVTFAGVLSLAFSGGTYTNGSTVQVYDYTTYTNNFDAVVWSGLPGSQQATFDPLTGYVTVIPEPGPVALVGGGLALLVVLRRRRK